LVQQTTNFINALPGYLSNIGVNSSTSGDIINGILGQFGGLSGEVLNFTFSIFSNFLGVLTVLVFAFYMLLSHSDLKNQVEPLFGESRGQRINKIVVMIEERLGKWARGQLLLMLAIAVGMYLGLLLIGIPFALPLAILSGLFEIIPFLGPIVSAIPAILIGFGISPLVGVGVTAFAFLIHQLENYILVPKIMEKSVGVSPLLILISITIGAKLAGLMGIIVAIPFVIMLQVLIKEYFVKE
jgi:predicted PurR-regulated permease PerM